MTAASTRRGPGGSIASFVIAAIEGLPHTVCRLTFLIGFSAADSQRHANKVTWSPGPGLRVVSVERVGDRWIVAAVGRRAGSCPGCGARSMLRRNWRIRHLQDLPSQGVVVSLRLRLSRWRCRNGECERETFVERTPDVFAPFARRTRRSAELVQLFGHSAGGKPGERLMKRLGAPASDDPILRHLKRQVAVRKAKRPVRVAGIDDWSWRKGGTYGAIVVDLERREVVDAPPNRSAAVTANWLKEHPLSWPTRPTTPITCVKPSPPRARSP